MVTISVGTPVTATATSTNETCAGACNGTGTLVAGGGFTPYTIDWTGTPTGDGTTNVTALCSASYTVTVTDVIGCTATDNITVTGPPAMSSTSAQTNVTCNAGCNGTATITPAGGTPPYVIAWSDGETTPTAGPLCAGTYTVTATDANGCFITATYTITEPAAFVIDPVTPVIICYGTSATLNATATGGTGAYTFNWATPAFTGPSYTVSPTTTTTYTVSGTDAAGCASVNSPTVTVTVRPPLGVNASADVSICPGASTTISATGNGGNGVYTYTWLPGGMTGASQTVSPAVTTTYTVTVDDGCSTPTASDTVRVTVLPVPVVSFTSNVASGCAPFSVSFTDMSSVSGGTIAAWSWDFGIFGTSASANPIVTYSTPGVYNVTLTVTSAAGCVSTLTMFNMITANAQPVANFIYDPQPATIAAPTISFHDQSINGNSWYWEFGDTATGTNNFSNLMDPTHMYSDTGTFCVTMIVTGNGGCTDTMTDCNLVITPEYTFWIPNSFSPNHDGLNDTFQPKGEFIDEYVMRIYDRWGELAFFTDDFYKGWNGKKNNVGEVGQEDVYVYIIQIKDKTGQRHQYIGHVTIIK
jgi:gliding motility-associated-like protein